MKRLTSFGFSLVLFGCAQGEVFEADGPAVEPRNVEAPLAAPARTGDCKCQVAPGAVASDRVDVSHIDVNRAPSRGRADAKVTMLVFCDLECPFCRRADSTLSELERSYGDDLRIVFKQLPLPMHENARLYAKAALAAQDQGKFWPMHTALLHGERRDRGALEELASSLGLDASSFRAALDAPEMEKRIEREVDDATRAGASGTPTFVINGRKLTGAQPIETFKKAIDEALGEPM